MSNPDSATGCAVWAEAVALVALIVAVTSIIILCLGEPDLSDALTQLALSRIRQCP